MARQYFTSFLCLVFLIIAVIGVIGQDVQTQEFQEDGELTINCNAQTAEVPIRYNLIRTVELTHGATGERMAFLQHKDGTRNAVVFTEPKYTRDLWKFTLPTMDQISPQLSSASPNRALLTISATKSAAKCSDEGIYKCSVDYIDDNSESKFLDKETNYTSTGKVSIDPIRISPQFDDNDYLVNTTVTLTCMAKGPKAYAFQWQRNCPITVGYINWPTQNDVKEDIKTEIPSNDCNTYDHRQDLIFTTQLDLSGCDIKCQFGKRVNNRVTEEVVSYWNITVREPAPPDTGRQTSSSASSDALAIGLGVGLSVLVLIIIAVLIYVFWFRKRESKEKYKDDGHDNPDANNVDAHAPPPVFYSKPNKPTKSEKDDSWGANQGTGDSYPYEKDIRRKPYYDDENYDPTYDNRAPPPSSGRRRSNRRSRGDSVDDSDTDQRRRRSRDERRSYGDDPRHEYDDGQPYASTDISRSEDELSDTTGRPRPKPKRRTKYTPKESNDEKVLHYADLDLPKAGHRNEKNQSSDSGRDPVHYASIQV